jgi:PPOX class probable F420-dependent enzyme
VTDHQALQRLAEGKYIRLTTFKKNGTPVPTPVWLVRDGDHLLVISGRSTGKAKRLRNSSRVLVAPSDGRGRVKPGVTDVEATAQLLTDDAEVARLVGLLKKRYGFMYTVAVTVQKLRGIAMNEGVEIRITV